MTIDIPGATFWVALLTLLVTSLMLVFVIIDRSVKIKVTLKTKFEAIKSIVYGKNDDIGFIGTFVNKSKSLVVYDLCYLTFNNQRVVGDLSIDPPPPGKELKPEIVFKYYVSTGPYLPEIIKIIQDKNSVLVRLVLKLSDGKKCYSNKIYLDIFRPPS